MKPIRIFKSPLSGRYYATRSYKILENGLIEITGSKDDVTDDIEALDTRVDDLIPRDEVEAMMSLVNRVANGFVRYSGDIGRVVEWAKAIQEDWQKKRGA